MKALTKQQQKLAEDNINLAYSYVHKYGYKYSFEFDDAVSIAFVGLVKAVAGFDPSKNVKFSYYAYICMDTEFKMACRSKLKYDKLNVTQSLQDIYVIDSDSIELEQMIPDNTISEIKLFETVEQIKWAYNQLTDKEKQVILLYYKNNKQKKNSKSL